jgi:mono/diheme cytochrome c family protein
MIKMIGKAGLSVLGLAFVLQGSAAADFKKDIWPMMVESCLKCHGPDYVDKRGRTKKAKGDLRIDNKADFMKGGENGEVIVPGNAAKSSFYKLTTLGEDHDDIMPPKGDPLTKKQQDALKKWIDSGADFGSWTKATAAEIKKAQSK